MDTVSYIQSITKPQWKAIPNSIQISGRASGTSRPLSPTSQPLLWARVEFACVRKTKDRKTTHPYLSAKSAYLGRDAQYLLRISCFTVKTLYKEDNATNVRYSLQCVACNQ